MSIVDTVRNAITEELDRVSREIESELKAECPKRTGRTASSFHTEVTSEFSRFVGSDLDTAYWADEGNNQRLTLIKPIQAKALKFRDGSFHANALTYEGKHFVKAVADRHR